MIRTKREYGYNAALYGNPYSTYEYEDYLIRMDNALRAAPGSSYNPFQYQIDVIANHGLLYVNPYVSDKTQYERTDELLRDMYYRIEYFPYEGGWDYEIFPVKSVYLGCINIQIYPADQVVNKIWEHINNYWEPVVTIIDSNKIGTVLSRDIYDGSAATTLHYNVVIGIKERDGTRYFIVYDPIRRYNKREYKVDDYKWMMTIPPDVSGSWVYDYPYYDKGIDEPCYVMTVFS